MNTAMTEDQFKRLLEQNNAQLLKHIDERLDERLEQNNAVFFGQLSRHLDEQLSALRDEFKGETNRIYNAVDGLTKRLETDEQKRAAITAEQDRQNGWIGQLAQATGTKLIPEQ